MLIKLTEVCNNNAVTSRQTFLLREIFINPHQVVMIREDFRLKELNESGMIKEGLSPDHRFSKLTINRGQSGAEIVVVGDPTTIEEILQGSGPQLLRG
ncbi:hypothetical protein CMI37_38010 [Candidatus Pacearchaeota archaeon]|jgi:hypothetical protein|nr:hypothetical protein [Candidatus Pacearchaeota archaeon]|tara:strand:- start:1753 stop:2046 length:294 start_codon:yes stop_codon:yes gene_type:complete